MRALLLGTDFMYNSSGNLVPIEINTNVGFETNVPESLEEIFDLSFLSNFIISHNFTKLNYIGSINILSDKLRDLCLNLNVEYSFVSVGFGSITVPYIEDTEDILIIRSSYDLSAIVDEEYCKNKVNFLNLIKEKSFGTEFAYKDELGNLINNISTIEDYGNHPNFILKSIFPYYDRSEYPKLYKVSNQIELDKVLENVNDSYFLMKYHYNPTKKYDDKLIYVIRSLNVIFPPNLESIPIGKYTRLTTRFVDEFSTFDANTFEIDWQDKSKYITGDTNILRPKLLDMDQVEMFDGTFKYAIDLQVGDVLKTVKIYNPHDVDLSGDLTNYHITLEEFESGSTYTTSTIIDKIKIDKFTTYVTIKFTDGTDWSDTENSSYLILRNNEVRFTYLHSSPSPLIIGDEVILVDTSFTEFTSVTKIVEDITFSKIIFSGWEILVDGEHIFLTKTEGEGSQSFAAIEHNPTCLAALAPGCSGSGCSKAAPCTDVGDGSCACIPL